jgi:hypothetical protein
MAEDPTLPILQNREGWGTQNRKPLENAAPPARPPPQILSPRKPRPSAGESVWRSSEHKFYPPSLLKA